MCRGRQTLIDTLQELGGIMTDKKRAPFGSWPSPISAAMVASYTTSSAGTLDDLAASAGDVYWIEMRSKEGARYVVMRCDRDGHVTDVLPQPYNARALVHEYGGGSICTSNRTLFFSNYADQRLYRLDPGKEPRPITPEPSVKRGLRYADGRVLPGGNVIVCVRERHLEHGEVFNELVAIPTDGSSEPRTIAYGKDFYAYPRPSPDGSRLTWLAWDNPQMPWDGTEVWQASLASDGTLANEVKVAGGPDESIFQPDWSPSGMLHFVSDRSGWWSLYRVDGGRVEALPSLEADFGAALWKLGYKRYAFMRDGTIACIYSQNGFHHLGIIHPGSDAVETIETDLTCFYPPQIVCDERDRVWVISGSPKEPQSVRYFDPASGLFTLVHRAFEIEVDESFLSIPRSITYPTEGGASAHALFYPPANRDFEGKDGERPPLIVISHGGPTSSTRSHLQLGIQFWTSRGFAVVDVDYGGSTGYGREYRRRLNGMWGVVDLDDCVHAAQYLADQGEVDGHRLIIRGGSAGGYTTLCALTFRDVFAVGASYYGLADLEPFVDDTHKFEARYSDSLIGPYPEARAIYRERSPIHFADRITCPVILFQGLEDKIVPPAQAEIMVEALRSKGLPFAYIPFEGEQHGFRKFENIKHSLEAELYFYSRILGFELSDSIEPVEIENLPE
jgi:dipeptidyl aminopeptidase/acylaminoacyl peptidase